MNDLSDLSYFESTKALNRSSSFVSDPRSLYALYFYFEQLGYENCLSHIYRLVNQLPFKSEFELIKARFLLFHPGAEAESFFKREETFLSGSDLVYFHFLASAYYDKTRHFSKKEYHSDFCLKHYDTIGDYGRYMTSLAHKSDSSLDEINKVLSHSNRSDEYKASGVCYLSLSDQGRKILTTLYTT